MFDIDGLKERIAKSGSQISVKIVNAPNPIYRKLKEYVSKSDNVITSIFGTLYDSRVVYFYEDDNGVWKEYQCPGIYKAGEKDFLYEYYVVGMIPKYKIVSDTIIPYLTVTLAKEV